MKKELKIIISCMFLISTTVFPVSGNVIINNHCFIEKVSIVDNFNGMNENIITDNSESIIINNQQLNNKSKAPEGWIDPLKDQAEMTSFSEEEFIPREIIIKFRESLDLSISSSPDGVLKTGLAAINLLNEEYDVSYAEQVFKNNPESSLSNVYRFIFADDADILSVAKAYSMDLNVVYAEPNYLYQLCNVPNDPLFDQQWALHNTGQTGGTLDADIDALEAWDVTTGDSDIIIAVVDSGIDYDHEDLADNIWINSGEIPNNGVDDDNNGYIDDLIGWDFYNDDNDPVDDFGHGTFCAGIVAAVTDNGVGVSGVCWNCKIMSLKGGHDSIPISSAVEGIVYAADNGADVISMSWGGFTDSSATRDALDYAYDKGLVLVAGAGNMNVDRTHYPSGYDNVIAVAATDYDDYKASFSNYGVYIDISTPGVNILSLRADDTDMYGDGTHIVDEYYYIASGTSASCPFAAGVVGLVLSKNNDMEHDAVKAILQNSVDKVVPYEEIGRGRLNAYYAVMQEDSPAKAMIMSPSHGEDIAGSIDIRGTAMGEGFQYFVLEYGMGRFPSETSWIEIVNSTTTIEEDVIGSLDTVSIGEGMYNIRLKVVCTDGIYIDKIWIVINNAYNTVVVDDDNTEGPWDGTSEHPYKTIHDGINNAGIGDTVYVHSGTYNERVNIWKSIYLTGENKGDTIIDGGGSGEVVKLLVDGVTISGFTVRNSGKEWPSAGIKVRSNNNLLYDNIITNNNYVGIYFVKAFNNIISGNTITNNFWDGIQLEYSEENIISGNTITGNQETGGIIVYHSSDNTITDNNFMDNDNFGIHMIYCNTIEISDNTFISDGIFLVGGKKSHYNSHEIKNNVANGKPIRYYKNSNNIVVPADTSQVILANCHNCIVQNLDLINVDSGIELGYSSNNIISNNNIEENFAGIEMFDSFHNTISENNFANNEYPCDIIVSYENTISGNTITSGRQGIDLWYFCIKNTITSNTITDILGEGISLIHGSWKNEIIQNNITHSSFLGAYVFEDSRYNLFYHNNFIDNYQNAAADSINIWYSKSLKEGNYWDDYKGIDILPPYGIGDSAYKIRPSFLLVYLINPLLILNRDRFPLMNPYTNSQNSHENNQINPQNNQQEIKNSNNYLLSSDSPYGKTSNPQQSSTGFYIENSQSYEDINPSIKTEETVENIMQSEKTHNTVYHTSNTIYVDDDNTEGPWDGTIEHPYQHIQEGIDAADDGDTVYVFGGVYHGNLICSKSIMVTGEDKNDTIIEGSVRISYATNAEFSSFTIQYGSGSFITLIENSHNCAIKNNIIKNLRYSETCIDIWFSSNLDIQGNAIYGNPNLSKFTGIAIQASPDNTITDNYITKHRYGIILLSDYTQGYSKNNNISNNVIENNEYGIDVGPFSKENFFSGNTIRKNEWGIELWSFAKKNIFYKNIIANNSDLGIEIMPSASKNKFIANNITNNDFIGIWIIDAALMTPILSPYYNNEFYYNNFIENGWSVYSMINACDWAYNIWFKNEQSSGYGNYWDDYNGVDADGNGIGDTPYNIWPRTDYNLDFFPFMEPIDIDNVEIAVESINEIANEVSQPSIQQPLNSMKLKLLEQFPILERIPSFL